jgi:protein-S-isoprenylcysteine O-methyltransferase Ste14
VARPFQFRLRTLLLVVPLVGTATFLARYLPISVTIAAWLVVLAACLFALSTMKWRTMPADLQTKSCRMTKSDHPADRQAENP